MAWPWRVLGCAVLACTCISTAWARSPPGESTVIPDGYYDDVTYDPTLDRLYVGRGDGLTVVSLSSGTIAFWQLPGQYFHLALPLPDGHVLVTDGGQGRVLLLDGRTGQVSGAVDVGGHPDSAVLEPSTGTVFVFNAANHIAAVVGLAPLRKLAAIDIGDAAEFAATDGQGRVFVNLRNRAAIAVINAATRRLVARWPLAGCQEPSGLSFDRLHNVLVAACDNRRAPVLDSLNGQAIALLDICGGADAVIGDPMHQRFFIPCGDDAVMDVIGWTAHRTPAVTQIIRTSANARTGAYAPARDTIYLPAAETGAGTIPQFGGTAPKPIPGTARLLVIHAPLGVSAQPRN